MTVSTLPPEPGPSRGWLRRAAGQVSRSLVSRDGEPTARAESVVLSALTVQRSTVMRHVRGVMRRHPGESPAQIGYRLGVAYRRLAGGSGAASGAVAIVPGIGTIGGLGVSVAGSVGFLELSALYAQSVAELHGLRTHTDREAQALVMAVLLGREGRGILQRTAHLIDGRGNLAATALAVNNGSGVFDAMFQQLTKTFMKRFATSQDASIAGRVIPFGIGAVVGGVGNHRLATGVIGSAAELFGEFPAVFPAELTAPPGEPGQRGLQGPDSPDPGRSRA